MLIMTRFSQIHNFEKPNDRRSIDLMNRCAIEVMKDIKDITMAYGQSDEYSFVLPKTTNLYSRRSSKIASTIVSLFASNFVMHWSTYFGDEKLQYAPCFDSRVVCYPNDQVLRDYLSWRQADCHINNLYNTTFWALVKSGMKESEAEAKLRVCALYMCVNDTYVSVRDPLQRTRMKFFFRPSISITTI